MCQALTRHTAQSHLRSCLVCVPGSIAPSTGSSLVSGCAAAIDPVPSEACAYELGVSKVGANHERLRLGALQGVAGEAAAAPPPRVQPPTRTSSSQAASVAAVIPGATVQLGRPGVVTACEYRASTSKHQDCRLVLRLMSSDAMGGEACCSTFLGSPGQPSYGISSCSPSCRLQADLVVCFPSQAAHMAACSAQTLSIQ